MKDSVQNKLYNYEADPPPRVWDKIAAALENEDGSAFNDKLYYFEEQPPSKVWEKINEHLDNKKTPPPVNFFRSYKKYFAAAAAVLILLFTSLIVFLSKKPVHNIPVRHLATHVHNHPIPTNKQSAADSAY